jgi:flagellar protein FlgJ
MRYWSPKKQPIVDLMPLLAMKHFHKPRKKPVGLIATLIVSNIILITVIFLLGGITWATTKVNVWITDYYAKERSKLIQTRNEQAIAMENLNIQISRLVGLQTSSPEDILHLARKISSVLDTASGQQRQFIEQALPHAIRIQVQYGIPASVTIAQSAYESKWGASELALQAHNYFGLKAYHWNGATVTMVTKDLNLVHNAKFRSYPDRAAGYQGYADFLRENDRYKSAFHTQSGEEFLKKILAAGYCPTPGYAADVKSIMKRYNLPELDDLLKQGANAPYQMVLNKKNSEEPIADDNAN